MRSIADSSPLVSSSRRPSSIELGPPGLGLQSDPVPAGHGHVRLPIDSCSITAYSIEHRSTSLSGEEHDHIETTEHHRVAIVGTGFSGLGAAIALKKDGVDFVVLERAGRRRRHVARQHLPRLPVRRPVAPLLVLVRTQPGLEPHLLAAAGDLGLPAPDGRRARRPRAHPLRRPTSAKRGGTRRTTSGRSRRNNGDLHRGRPHRRERRARRSRRSPRSPDSRTSPAPSSTRRSGTTTTIWTASASPSSGRARRRSSSSRRSSRRSAHSRSSSARRRGCSRTPTVRSRASSARSTAASPSRRGSRARSSTGARARRRSR